jgi:hypothetical protein
MMIHNLVKFVIFISHANGVESGQDILLGCASHIIYMCEFFGEFK